jgi:alpha-beta hydrolase superfamily lysophospholipase
MTATLATDDGLDLFLHDWPLAAPRGTVLLVHGLGEHGGRYAHVAASLNAWGWRVLAHDQRGHGRSGGERGRIASDDALLRDLARVIDVARAEQRGPLLLLGHSMGGLIASRFVAEGLQPQPAAWHREVDSLVLTSPALAIEMNPIQKLLLATLGPLAPNLAVANGLDPAWVSRDPAVVAAYVADPLVHDRITPRLTRFIVDGGELVRRLAPRWSVPTLLMWAGSDRCVAPSGSAEFAAAAPKDVLQSQVFEPLFHEILNEPEQAQVFARLQDWLQRWA